MMPTRDDRLRPWARTAGRVVGVLLFGGSCLTAGSAPATDANADTIGATLTIATDPAGASVLLDGRLRGVTPLALEQVAAGEHRVRVDLDGYLENSRAVVLEPGDGQSLRLVLTPSAAREARPQGASEPPAEAPVGQRKGGRVKKVALATLGAAAVGASVALVLARDKPPTVAGLTALPAAGSVGIACVTPYTFTAHASDPDRDDTLSYEWDFGDGGRSTEAGTTIHTYAQADSYDVTVTVKDLAGKSATASTRVTVGNVTGTWVGTYAGDTRTWVIAQYGTTVSGAYEHSRLTPVHGPGTARGVLNAPREITITAGLPDVPPFVFRGTFDNTLASIDGQANGAGFVDTPMRFIRQ